MTAHGLDLPLFLLVNQEWRSALLDVLMPLVSHSPFMWGLAGLATLVAARKGEFKRLAAAFLVLLLAAGLADLAVKPLKKHFGRVRPEDAVAGTFYRDEGRWARLPVDFVQTRERGSGMPSAHAANSMAVALAAMCLWPALGRWPLLLPLVVGYSRLYVGKHYPADVLAGWAVGCLVGLVVALALGAARRRWPGRVP